MATLPFLSRDDTVRRVIAALGATRDEVRAILERESDALIAFDARRTIIAANPSAESFFGYDRGEMDGRSTDGLVPERLRQPDAPPPAVTPDVASVDLPGLRRDGQEVEVVWTFGSAPGPDGPIFVLLVRDRAELLAAIQQLEKSAAREKDVERRFRSIYENALDGFLIVDDDLRIVDANPAACRLLRTDHDRLVGQSAAAFVPSDGRQTAYSLFQELRAAGTMQAETAISLPDGARRRVEFNSVANISPGLHLTIFRDIEDRKRLEEASLHASEDRFHQLVGAIRDYAIFLLDATGRVTTWNPGAEKIKGYTADEIIGQHFSVFYTPDDRAAGKPQRVLEAARRDGRFEDESWRVRKDGSRFWADVVISALRDGSGEVIGFAKVTRDLTERRAAEEKERQLTREQLARAESERLAREWERVNQAKDEFLATMSHELRTPLNAISGWATILRRKPREEAKLDRGLEVIERNVKAQTKLIGDLLDVSRIITGKLNLSVERVDVFPVLAAAADVVRPAAEAKGVRLVLDVAPDVGATMGDPVRLQQVVWNLLTNAIRFTPRGGRVTVTADRTASGLVLRVQDTGAGIDVAHLPHLFERFMQVDSSTTRAHGGLGLGLAIVRHLVEAHGGTVEAHSEGLGRGSTFTVSLPISSVDAARPPRADRGAREPMTMPARSDALAGVRVLVVDDEQDSVELLCAVLESAGARVTSASSARQAFDLLDARGPFDVVVSDIGMPEMDGYALIREIRAGAHAQLPAIALTAYARPEDAESAMRAGYQQHLVKPVEEARLLEAVRIWSSRARVEGSS